MIKFRAWDIKKKMYIGFGSGKFSKEKRNNFTNPSFDSEFDGIMTLNKNWFYGDNYNVIWEQYTGEKDKNKKEIFKGDRVNSGGHKNKTIIFYKGCFGFKSALYFRALCEEDLNEIEVIGTIHDQESEE